MEIVINVECEEDREPLRQAVESVVSQVSLNLDLTMLDRMIFPNDFGEELIAFQKSKGLREGFTDTEHGRAFGKTLYYFVDDELRSIIFLDNSVAYGLYSDELKQRSANLIHHELCHVHDETVKVKDIGTELVNEKGHDIESTLLVHADSVWSEYVAVKLSFPTLDRDGDDPFYLVYFRDLIGIVKADVEKAIGESSKSKDWWGLFKTVQMSSNLLLRIAATLLANVHIINSDEVDDMLNEFVSGTFLGDVWDDLNRELKRLEEWHGRWGSAEFLKDLGDIIYSVWKALRVEVLDVGDKQIYVGVIEE